MFLLISLLLLSSYFFVNIILIYSSIRRTSTTKDIDISIIILSYCTTMTTNERRGLLKHGVISYEDINSIDSITLIDNTNSNTVISIIIAVKQLGIDTLKDTLNEVSDPDSPKYSRYLSKDTINSITRNVISKNKILEYFTKYNTIRITSITSDDNYITITSDVKTFEEIFHTTFYTYRIHSSDYVRAHSYVIPHALIDLVHAVFDIVDIPIGYKQQGISNTDSTIPTYAGSVTPALLHSIYSIDTTIVGTMNTSQCVYAELNQTAHQIYFNFKSYLVYKLHQYHHHMDMLLIFLVNLIHVVRQIWMFKIFLV